MAALVCIALLAMAVRIRSAQNDLWLDELWSIGLATNIASAFRTFSLHHEINHYLNTLWAHAIGAGHSPIVYRALSIVTGTGTVLVAGLIGLRRSAATAIIAMVLMATSYVLIVFSTEARGYAAMVFAALVAYAALDGQLPAPRRRIVAFNIAAVIGVLAHPMFVSVFGAAAIWMAARLWRTGGTGNRAKEFAIWFAAPGVLLAVLYVFDLALVRAGGGTPSPLFAVYFSATAWAVAPPRGVVWEFMAIGVLAVTAASALWIMRRERREDWVFFVAAIVVCPLALMLWRRSDLVYVRHFVVGTAFLLLLSAITLGDWWQRGRAWQAVVITLVAAYVITNAVWTRELWLRGRGQYSDAVAYLRNATPGGLQTIGGEQDWRIGMVLRHYLAEAQLPDVYVPTAWGRVGVQWFIAHSETFGPAIPRTESMTDPLGNRYVLDRTFASAPLTGLNWFLYRHSADSIRSR